MPNATPDSRLIYRLIPIFILGFHIGLQEEPILHCKVTFWPRYFQIGFALHRVWWSLLIFNTVLVIWKEKGIKIVRKWSQMLKYSKVWIQLLNKVSSRAISGFVSISDFIKSSGSLRISVWKIADIQIIVHSTVIPCLSYS